MRFERRDGQLVEAPPAADVVTEATVDGAVEARPERTERTERPEGDRGGRDRDRGGRDRFEGRGDRNRDRDRDRDRGPRRDNTETVAEIRTEDAAPATESETPTETTKVDDVAARALERADRGTDKAEKKGKKKEVTTETREFWETWAEEKSTRPASEPAAEGAPAETAEAAPAEGEERPRRERGGRGGRDRGGRGEKRREKGDVLEKEKSSRTKRDTAVSAPPAAAAADTSQARLFISLGKKHGVSADDLRTLLAGPIGGDTARIGSVSLRDSHAHVRVPEETVDAIVAALNGTQHNEHEVTVERARA